MKLLKLALIFVAMPAFAEIDGIITPGEYSGRADFDGISVHWNVDADYLNMGIESAASGWVAVGFDPVFVMDQADIVFAVVPNEGAPRIIDAFSTGVYGPHPPDTELGGKDDLLAAAAIRNATGVVVEFRRRLETGDKFDKPLSTERDVKLIWALSDTLGFDDFHSKAGSTLINLAPAGGATLPTAKAPLNSRALFFFLHFGLMALATLFMVSSVAVAMFFRKKKWWMVVHRRLGDASAVGGILGIASAFAMLAVSESGHLRVPHAYVGYLLLLFLVGQPLLGRLIFTFKGDKKRLRAAHRRLGRLAVVAMLANAVSGLVIVGIIRF